MDRFKSIPDYAKGLRLYCEAHGIEEKDALKRIEKFLKKTPKKKNNQTKN